MEIIKLSPRLQMNVDLINKCKCVADIGCDHAYASIWLYVNGIAQKVIAMDVNEGPLQRAKENIHKYNVQSGIDVRLSNGTQKLEENEADCLMIAGMGGLLIVDILSARPEITKVCEQLVVQPQSDIHKVRRFLRENGFAIDKEYMVEDEGKFYTSIHAVKRNEKIKQYNVEENIVHDMYGEYLLRSNNKVLKKYLINQKNIFSSNLEKAGSNKELNEKISIIEEGLQYYGM